MKKSKDLGVYDVAIIGLGVAGSNLAANLKPHLKVIAIDKKDKEGDCFDDNFHKPCGGLLSEGGQKALAKQGLNLPNEVLVNPQIFAINTIDFGFKHASYIQKGYVNMERHKFDLWLKGLILSHIHSFHCAYFKSIKKDGTLYQVYFKQEQGNVESNTQYYTCKARIVVGADGAKSHIRRFLYPHLQTQSLVCIQQWYKEHNKPMLSCIFDKTLTPSYSWSMSKDGYFIFGGAYPHAHCKTAFNTQKARLEGLGFTFTEVLKQEACLVLQPQRWRDFVRGRSGIFLIGEAAGFINASTLEGISGALHSSRILSEVLNGIKSCNKGESSVELDSKTLENLHSAYSKRTRLLVLKTLFRHYVRYPFMFITPLRRIILFCGILRVRPGMMRDKII